MCDYSLHSVASRPARVGDKLVTTRFRNSETRGFASVDEPEVAVCLMPGTEVAFERPVARSRFLLSWLRPNRNHDMIGEKVARFRHVNVDMPSRHHDALEFPNGKVVLLTHLRIGQHATVLQLPASGTRAPSETAEYPETALA